MARPMSLMGRPGFTASMPRMRHSYVTRMRRALSSSIFRRSDSKSGIGIKNVDDRLKIWFGEAYGITIESEPDRGTRVIVRMPKKQKE